MGMKKIIIAISVITGFLYTQVSFAEGADIVAGKTSYDGKCASCHGAKGQKPILPTYPRLGGQNAPYFVKQINDFKSGTRKDPTMNAMSNLLQGSEVENVAAYLESIGKEVK
jgi:cytochrome c553